MTYRTSLNRAEALGKLNPNLCMLLRERHRFLRDYIHAGDRVLEIGAGIGVADSYLPEGVSVCHTDVEENPWIDAVTSAEALPFPPRSFDAVICIAALHHMRHPLAAMREFARVLSPNGVALIMEVHVSWLTRLVLGLTKHEYIDLSVDPFGPDSCQPRSGSNWDGNNAIGDLLFSDRKKLEHAIPDFRIVHHRYTESFLFINSGGVNFKVPYLPLPGFILESIASLDRFLGHAAPDIFSICQEIVLRRHASIE